MGPASSFGGSATETGSFTAPRGIAICHGCAAGGNDLVLITDNFAGKVHVFRHRVGGRKPGSIRFVSSFGRDGTTHGEFSPGHDLRGVAIDPATKRVYVVDAASGWTNSYNLRGQYLGVRFDPAEFSRDLRSALREDPNVRTTPSP